MKKQTIWTSLLIFIMMIVSITTSASAQDEEGYRVSLRREFGYGAGSNVRGTMSLRLVGDEEAVEQVAFFIDDKPLVTVQTSPFKTQFDTDNIGVGWHDMKALVTLKDGRQITTPAIRYNFISVEEQNSGLKNILLPIGVVLISVMGISALIQTIGKPKKGQAQDSPRQYGPLGGTICPKCGHPFSRSLFGINLVVGRLERCEACGKFVMTTRATPTELAAAEAAEKASVVKDRNIEEVRNEKEETGLVDESKYIDHL